MKREYQYGIIGDPSVSVATPSSDLVKINKTYREFLKDANYQEEDKQILLEVFEAGN